MDATARQADLLEQLSCQLPALRGQQLEELALVLGQAGGDDPGRRFRWLIAPRSTVVQPGPVHTGLTADPKAEADRLLDLLVR